MKKLALVALAVVVMFSAVGCFGPRNLTRQFDDWLNQQYVNQPWLVSNTISMGLIGIAWVATTFVDSIVDVYYFWGKDAWPFGSGHGTAFTHKAVTPPAGK